jgi:hypothetical protein
MYLQSMIQKEPLRTTCIKQTHPARSPRIPRLCAVVLLTLGSVGWIVWIRPASVHRAIYHGDSALVFVGLTGRSYFLVVMAVVEDLAYTATCALGDFACALDGSNSDVLAGDACALAYVARGVNGVEGDEIASAFAHALGCRSGSFGSALADVAGSASDVTAGAAWLRLGLRAFGGGRLGGGALAADDEG